MELNFRYIDYQTLAHLSYRSCVYWVSVYAIRVQRFSSVQVLISDSTEESVQSVDWATTHACMNNLYKNKLRNKACTIITFITMNTSIKALGQSLVEDLQF